MEKITRFISYLFLITIPFGYRITVYQFTPGWHEYETAFWYISDFGLGLFLVFGIVYLLKNNFEKPTLLEKTLLAFLTIGLISIFVSKLPFLGLYILARLSAYVLMAIIWSRLLKSGVVRIETILKILLGLVLVESIIAIGQFWIQKDLGLRWLGEPNLSPFVAGVGKMIIGGGQVLRAHGTFLHPNILGAWLMIGWVICLSFLKKNISLGERIILVSGMYFIASAVIFTFSRSAWIAFLVVSLIFLLDIFFSNKKGESIKNFILIFMIGVVAILPMKEFVLPRTQIKIEDVAVTERISYIKMGGEIIKQNPLGVGVGNQVYYSYESGLYKKFGMNKSWLWQPIHNFYILMASEIGWLGLVVWFGFVIGLIKTNFRTDKKRIAFVMFVGFLILGLFDHYLWTIALGQLMLWTTIGLLL